MDIFQQASEAAQKLIAERDQALKEAAFYRVELESTKLALSQAQSVASGRMAMVYELTAQLGTLGAMFATCSAETKKIIEKVNSITPPTEGQEQTITPSPGMEVELVGPYVGIEPKHTPEGDTNIPFAPRTKLLSETAIPIPAYLRTNGFSTKTELNQDEIRQLSWAERTQYKRLGIIPSYMRK